MTDLITISEPWELSSNFTRVQVAFSHDFDGLPTATVLYNGLPVAFFTHPESNYGDASPPRKYLPDGLPGAQLVLSVLEGDGQDQCVAGFYAWVGEVDEEFAAAVAEHGFWKAMENEEYARDDGHSWCAFIERIQHLMHKWDPEGMPESREYLLTHPPATEHRLQVSALPGTPSDYYGSIG